MGTTRKEGTSRTRRATLQAVDLRHHHVENEEVRRGFPSHRERRLAVLREIHRVTLPEDLQEHLGDRLVVFCDQDAPLRLRIGLNLPGHDIQLFPRNGDAASRFASKFSVSSRHPFSYFDAESALFASFRRGRPTLPPPFDAYQWERPPNGTHHSLELLTPGDEETRRQGDELRPRAEPRRNQLFSKVSSA